MDNQLFGIAAFRSRQQVMRFEATLRRAGIEAKIISTPKDVAIGCGLSVQFDLRDLRQVQSYLSGGQNANLIGVYQVDRRGGGRSRLTALAYR